MRTTILALLTTVLQLRTVGEALSSIDIGMSRHHAVVAASQISDLVLEARAYRPVKGAR